MQIPSLPPKNAIYKSVAWFSILAVSLAAVANIGLLAARGMGLI